MFYFDSNTTVPLQCAALVVWKAYGDRMSFGWLFLGIPIKFLPGAYQTNSVLASGQWTFSDISSDARFNFYKDDLAVHHQKTFKCLNLSIGLTSSNWKLLNQRQK